MRLEKFININWFLERKPYTIHTDYDVFYLKICRDLFTLINKLVMEHSDAINLDEEECREMAYRFTAYFEDQVNNIGFWKSLTALHKKQFNKHLPFFDSQTLQQQEEEYGDILPADIHYLAYITYLHLFAGEGEKLVVFFNKPFFTELTQQVFNYLDEIEEVLTTDFYEKYLVPESDYIKFKEQLDWFTFEGYLTGIEFYCKMDDYILELMEQEQTDSLIPPLLHAERDRLLFEEPSSLTAFFPADLLAEAMRCDERKKQQIRNLKWRAHGIFHLQRETPTHYMFLHTATGEEFEVLKSSFNQPIDTGWEEYWITTVVGWNEDFYISGLCYPSPYKGEKIHHANLENQHNFQRHFAPYREQIKEIAQNFSSNAKEFFGSELNVFDTGHQLQEKLIEFGKWYFYKVVDQSKLPGKEQPMLFKLPKELLAETGIALFIPPIDGIEFIPKHQQLLHLLQTKETDKVSLKEIEEVIPILLDEVVGIDYWYYLKKNVSVPNLTLLMKCPADREEDFEALLRIYKPGNFSPLKLPAFTTFSSEKINPETVREIFKGKYQDRED